MGRRVNGLYHKATKSKDPVTGITYNLIMVIMDRFTKYLIAVPFKETHTAEQLGHLLLDRLVRDHGVLITIITDRDKLFTSNYWKTIRAAMGTKPKMSTAYHPRTDSQTERVNQVLETYLRHYINKTHSNWVQLLLVAQLAINQHRSDSTKESLFLPILDNMRTSGYQAELHQTRRKHSNMTSSYDKHTQ